MEDQVCSFYAAVNGYMDAFGVERVRPFEQGLLSVLKSKHADLLKEIREKKQLGDDLKAKLDAVVKEFAASFK
jgi:F-type H+-transporting ATPase subunit alpha